MFLAASDGTEEWSVWDDAGLSTVACLEFLLTLPRVALVIGFAFQYDLTKLLADLPDRLLWRLLHEESRAVEIDGRTIYSPVSWRGFSLNYANRRLTVSRKLPGQGVRRATVWDFFKFFQCSFVKALTDWDVGAAEIAAIAKMKGQRARFARMAPHKIRRYCLDECRLLSQLGRRLIDAHTDAGIPLKRYDGPGSTASVLLGRMSIAEKRGELPREMRHPVACAFFGGRFEDSASGRVVGPVYGYDLASAYPYAATFLPCLEHARWRWEERPYIHEALSACDPDEYTALVGWATTATGTRRDWGGLPVRSENGSIVFPLAGVGGWAWLSEWQAARQLNPYVHAVGAFVAERRCDCRPFAELPTYYRERVRWGKDGPGRALKLGTNSVYGKLAQSMGAHPPFQSWVWAGLITAQIRAEMLRAISGLSPWAVISIATDGFLSREPWENPRAPKETGTSDLKKPLGVWEEKVYDDGVFLVRPGIYLGDELRARGIGRSALSKHAARIQLAHEAGRKGYTVRGMRRFVGARTGLTRTARGEVRRSADYGEWVPYPIRLSFSPAPKRRMRDADGRLVAWTYTDWESEPYDPARLSPDAAALTDAEIIASEQPEGLL